MSSRLKDRPVKPKRGRPPVLTDVMRLQRLLEAAERVFTNIGYGAATMEEIARAAGMSKRTVYALFPDKRALFTALINVIDVYPDDQLRSDRTNSRSELRERLLSLAELALSKRQVEMTRLVISEARNCPELAEEFHAKGMAKGRAYLVAALRSFADENPETAIADIEGTAVMLFAAILGDVHFRALLGEQTVSKRQLGALVDSAMSVILPDPGR